MPRLCRPVYLDVSRCADRMQVACENTMIFFCVCGDHIRTATATHAATARLSNSHHHCLLSLSHSDTFSASQVSAWLCQPAAKFASCCGLALARQRRSRVSITIARSSKTTRRGSCRRRSSLERARAHGLAQRRVDHGADAEWREDPEPAHDERAPELLPDDGEVRGPAAVRLVVQHVSEQVDRHHHRLDQHGQCHLRSNLGNGGSREPSGVRRSTWLGPSAPLCGEGSGSGTPRATSATQWTARRR